MTPTPHLEWVDRVIFDGDTQRVERVLQQLWRAHHIPPGQTQAHEEWRDVPMIKEEAK